MQPHSVYKLQPNKAVAVLKRYENFYANMSAYFRIRVRNTIDRYVWYLPISIYGLIRIPSLSTV